MTKNFLRKQSLFSLLILFVIGGFFRFYKLSFQSYWLDEAITVMRILRSVFFFTLKNGFGVGDPLYMNLFYICG